MRIIRLTFLFGTLALTGCASSEFNPSAAASSSDDSSPTYVDTPSPAPVDTSANDALMMADQMAATQAANDAAQAQNNAAQADAVQTMVNANNSAPPQ